LVIVNLELYIDKMMVHHETITWNFIARAALPSPLDATRHAIGVETAFGY
jgi:hypothetical protein